nr:hypothetical protein BaRGS_027751 [Batillaria attramentaria]
MVYDPSARLCHLANATARPDCSNMVSPETSLKYYESVYCRMLQTKTPTTVLSRTSTATSFNRTWQEYKDGFGDASGDYFIGLERLHQLTTSKDYELRFRVRLDNKTNYYQYYRSFVLNDESENYSFTFNYTLHFQVLGDCLGNLQGVGFSAFDRDNDGDSSINCAQQNGGGWWFSGASCSSCSPLGLILEPFDGWKKGVPGEAYWDGVLGDVLPFTFSMYVVI